MSENEVTQTTFEPQSKKAKKVAWSLKRCKKAANRFNNVDEWANGAPSSYKAACSHGWLDECTSHMDGSKVVGISKAKKKGGKDHNYQQSA